MVEKLDFKDAHRQITSGTWEPARQLHWMHSLGKEKGTEEVRQKMMAGLMRISDNPTWLPAYDKIAEWMADNQGRGLVLMGGCGTGKTVMANYIIPTLLQHYYKRICTRFDATQLAMNPDIVMQYHILVIDDVGTESETVTYGQRRQAFAELMDTAEKKGKTLILTTNLTLTQLEEKYGQRVTDRIRGLTLGVKITGESFRKRKPDTVTKQ